MEFKMNRNGSGAYDGTAYNAMMGAPKAGEIWTFKNGYAEKEVLVIKNHGTVCTTVSLVDEQKGRDCIEIVSKSIKYCVPYMLQYSFNQSFGEFIKKLPDEEFDCVLDAIEDALDLKINRPDEEEVNEDEVNEAVEVLEEKVKELEALLAKAQEVCDSGYKEKYQKLVLELIDRGLMDVVMR